MRGHQRCILQGLLIIATVIQQLNTQCMIRAMHHRDLLRKKIMLCLVFRISSFIHLSVLIRQIYQQSIKKKTCTYFTIKHCFMFSPSCRGVNFPQEVTTDVPLFNNAYGQCQGNPIAPIPVFISTLFEKKISQTGFQNFPKRKTITIWNKKASQNTSLLEMYVLAQTSQLRPESNWIQQKENKVEGIPSYPSAQNPYFPRCHPGTTQTTYYTAPSEGTILCSVCS